MPISPSILSEAEALAAPISAAEPAGKNPAGDERYQELRVEVDKENSPTGESVRWPRVADLGAQILKKVAKDLLVAAYMGFAMYRARGLNGLAVGFATVDLLLVQHWDAMFPPVARLKGRGTALRWLLEHAQEAVSQHTPRPEDAPAILALIEVTKAMRPRARELLGDHVPSFKEWSDLLESLRQTLPPEALQAADSAPPAAPEAAPVASDMSPGTAAASEPAPPTAAPAVDDPRAPVAAWLAPIAGANPAGGDVTGSDEYQGLLAEVDKLQSPSGGEIDWAKVVRFGDVVLQKQGKDLRVACHLALARYRTERLGGLALGLALIAELSDEYWDTMQPPVARLRGRVGTLRGLLDQLEPELSSYAPKPNEGPQIDRLKLATVRLQTVLRARLADQAPPLRLLIQTIDQLAMTVAAAAPPPPPVPEVRPPEPKPVPPPPVVAVPPPPVVTPPPVTSAPVSTPTASAAPTGDVANQAAVDRYLRTTGEELVKLANALRRARNADALAYRLLRSGLWVYIAAAPPSQPDGGTQIPGLGERDRARLEGLRGGGRWADLLEDSESMLPMARFALDLHRYSAEALQNLGPGHDAARLGLCAEVGALLRRLPRVLELKDREGVPLADEATRAWIEREVLPSGGGGGSAPVSAPVIVAAGPPGAEAAQLKALFAANKREDGLRLGAAQIQQAASGRDRYLRRLELAEACAEAKDAILARTLFAGLVADLDAQRLETWEPGLAVRSLDGLARSIPKGQPSDKPALDAALTRLASLDPHRAASIK